MDTNSLVWTKEKPVKAGWYWIGDISQTPKICRVVDIGGDFAIALKTGLGAPLSALRKGAILFAGPIPEPREAEAAPVYEDPSPTLLHPKPMVCILTPDEFREKGTMYGQQGAKGLYVQIVGTSKLSDGTPVYEVRA